MSTALMLKPRPLFSPLCAGVTWAAWLSFSVPELIQTEAILTTVRPCSPLPERATQRSSASCFCTARRSTPGQRWRCGPQGLLCAAGHFTCQPYMDTWIASKCCCYMGRIRTITARKTRWTAGPHNRRRSWNCVWDTGCGVEYIQLLIDFGANVYLPTLIIEKSTKQNEAVELLLKERGERSFSGIIALFFYDHWLIVTSIIKHISAFVLSLDAHQ